MTNILGPYYSPWHWRGEDEEYMRQLDSAWANIHQPSARAIETVQRNAPNARIMLRSWDIDDNNGERKREMYADPKGAARKHLDMWRVKWDELLVEMRRNGWQPDESRWYIGLVNEPDPAFVPQVVEYSLEAMRLVKGTMIRLGVVASSVGTFSKPNENDQGWTKFIPLEKPINDGGHILLVHEYWQPEGPNFGEDAGNLAWRHHSIPLDVPILIRESGANGYIYGRYSKDDDSGWQKTVKDPNVYAAQVKEYIEGCDQRVKGVLLYMLDFHSKQWWSFDTQPAMHQLLAIKTARPQKPSPFVTKPFEQRLPVIISPPPTGPHAVVTAPAGANVRTGPGTDYPVRGAEPVGAVLPIIGRNPARDWWKVSMQHAEGWVNDSVVRAQGSGRVPIVDVEPVTPAPSVPQEPPVSGDNWARCWPIVLKFEGGLSLDPNDTGNYYKGKLVGTKYGISAAVWGGQYDIPNLTKEQALSIYKMAYWDATGCDALAWPLCLAVFDHAINAGVGSAKQLLAKSGPNFLLFMADRITWYTRLEQFNIYGVAWIRRCAKVLREGAK